MIDYLDSSPLPDSELNLLSSLDSPFNPKVTAKKRPPPKMKIERGMSRYHWTRVEQKRYVNFLVENNHFFFLPQNERKNLGVNHRMSRAIKTRDTNQCRSHHQKMLMKFSSIQSIIKEYRKSICPRNIKKLIKCWGAFEESQIILEKQQTSTTITSQTDDVKEENNKRSGWATLELHELDIEHWIRKQVDGQEFE